MPANMVDWGMGHLLGGSDFGVFANELNRA